MRIVVWGINYAPEITGIAPHNVALCEFLRSKDDDVEMVSTFAYYPAWRKLPQDRHQLFRTDRISGVPIHRCWHFVPAQVSAWKRIIHEGTFVLTSTLRVLSLKRPDVYVIVSPPLLLGTAGWLVAKLKRAPFVFHVQDLQPDAAVGLGMLKAGWFTRALYWLERFAYRHATRVSGISQEIVDAFRRKGVPEKKLILFPNGVKIPDKIPDRGKFRERNGFEAGEFLAVYAGNLGVKQGLNILLDAAEQLRSQSNIRIVLCGDGAERANLEKLVEERQLTNVSRLPLQFGLNYQELLVDADVSVITQQSGSGNSFFPSKLLVTLAHCSPVVTVADPGSALARAVEEGGFGMNVVPGRPDLLANAFAELARQPERLGTWGTAGRAYVGQFERDEVVGRFRLALQPIVQPLG